jgi:gluconolactonase
LFYVCNNGGLRWVSDGDLLHPAGSAGDYVTGRIERIEPSSGKVERLYDHCAGSPLRAPNDLVFDGHGGFYFTDTGRNLLWAREYGRICYASHDGSKITEIAAPMFTPNGIGLSPDGGTLYVAETETARLWAFRIRAPGELEPFEGSTAVHGGVCIGGLTGHCRFDSLAVQANGDICVATLIFGCITVFSPAGEVIRQVPMPDRSCTNLCFGGPDMTTAFVTLSSTGRLVAMDWGEPGLCLAHLGAA